MFSCDDDDVLLAGVRRHGSKLLVKDVLTRGERDSPLEEKASEEAIKASKLPSANANLIARSKKCKTAARRISQEPTGETRNNVPHGVPHHIPYITRTCQVNSSIHIVPARHHHES
jgi:hypothetical protein